MISTLIVTPTIRRAFLSKIYSGYRISVAAQKIALSRCCGKKWTASPKKLK